MSDEQTSAVQDVQTVEPGDEQAVSETPISPESSTSQENTPASETAPTETVIDGDKKPVDAAEDGEGGGASEPVEYSDFKMPEGVTIDEAVMAKAVPLFKELGLNQDQAQKLVTLEAERMQEIHATQLEQFNSMVDEWYEQTLKDTEFGGDKLDESIGIANNALNHYGSDELKEVLKTYGLSKHPEVIRAFYRMGRDMKEDNPGGGKHGITEKPDRVSVLYPNG